MGVALNPLYSIAYGVRGRLGGNNTNLMEVRTMSSNRELTAETLREYVSYDPDTGLMTRIKSKYKGKIGQVADEVDKQGYTRISLFWKTYKVHRLAWLYVHGSLSHLHIDHIDGDKSNNRLANLREATRSENGQNRRRPQPGSKSGLLGATFRKDRGKWIAKIGLDGKRTLIGQYDTALEAHEAYMKAKLVMHPFGEIAKEARYGTT